MRGKTRAESLSIRVADIEREMQFRKKQKAVQKRKAQLARWREYSAKRRAMVQTQREQNTAARNLAVIVADKSEQRRAALLRWRLETENGLETKKLSEWCAYLSQLQVHISPVELEAVLRDDRRVYRSVQDVVTAIRPV